MVKVRGWAANECEICGGVPVEWIADIKEIDPFVDEGGQKWRCWDREAVHWRCADHPYMGKRTYQDGHVARGPSCMAESLALQIGRTRAAMLEG